MGRIKTLLIKKIGDYLLKNYKEKFTTDFEKNKQILKGLIEIKSKKLRNCVAGYITSKLKLESKDSSKLG